MTDIRQTSLIEWLKSIFPDQTIELTSASADASFRRYFRLQTPSHAKATSWVVMDAPPDKEDCEPFIRVAEAFRTTGLNVPEIIAKDLEQGFLVLTDFGGTCYLDKLSSQTADSLYLDAMSALINLQTCPKRQDAQLPPYDEPLLMREMNLFREWFIPSHLNLELDDTTSNMLDNTWQKLADMALAQPSTWVHRDYHSRNLMIIENGNPGIIDFQDAVIGPITYDLVSLLRDCYIDWPAEQVNSWVLSHLQQLQSNDICLNVDNETFIQWFDWMGIQRHLKAIGIFARLNYRDGKPAYLLDIPRTLNYVIVVSEKYPALSEFNAYLQKEILPALSVSQLVDNGKQNIK